MRHTPGFFNLSPMAFLSSGYVAITMMGAGILSLPLSSRSGLFSSYLDSMFTAASAITTTGLIVFDTGTYYSAFGQIVILLLVQIGGLGYMLFVVLVFLVAGRKISVMNNLMLQESVKRPLGVDVFHFTKIVVVYTMIIQFCGALLLSLCFHRYFPLRHSIYSGIFHAVSAFNTAGFSMYQDSFSRFVNDVPINLIVNALSILGALGFFVLYDVSRVLAEKWKGSKNVRVSVHTKLMLVCTTFVLLLASSFFFFTEHWNGDYSLRQKVLSSFFQVSTASTTTGFNSIDVGKIQPGNLFLLVLVMFIGAGSGGTGGGIKMTTFIVAMLSVCSIITNRDTVNVFRRRVPFSVIRNSLAIVILSGAWIALSSYLMMLTEGKDLMSLLFEITSAIGTVGLSTGITPGLSSIGKTVIILSMLIGRIGPLGIGVSLLKTEMEPNYRYSTTDIFIG